MKNEDRLKQLQDNHELFLQAFEKPTQIYRYLRTRNLVSPIFLYRTLTFMRARLSRPSSSSAATKRANFKVDSLLERREAEERARSQMPHGYLTVTFLGFYDKRRERPSERVGVEVLLVKLAHKKRKDSASPAAQTSLGTSEVPVNPSEDQPPSKAPAISVPSESFSQNGGGGHHAKSYSLVVRVHQSPFTQISNSGSARKGEENLEPSAKRRKFLRGSMDDGKMLTAEMVVYDKHGRCLLTDAEYELVLSETSAIGGGGSAEKISPKKNNTSWENISLDKIDKAIADQFDVFDCCPTLKFRLSWNGESASTMVERPRPLMPRENAVGSGSGDGSRSIRPRMTANNCGTRPQIPNSHHQQQPSRKLEKPLRIVYQFLYNNNTRQQTEAREDLHCPWCYLNCMELYALLKHLKLSHPRFLFTYVPIEEGARIDVSVSELYDSTYVGNPQDLISQPPGFAFSRYGPVQRTSITNIIVCKPKRTAHSLSEFLEVDGDNDLAGPYDGQRPFVTGHNRLYHYSTTCLPMPPHAILKPSTEDQVDPPWLMTKICRMIDEFSDVNGGEKDFMKMWNLHVQHYTYVGDCQMSLALRTFIEEKGREILDRNLYRNFILHCCNLFEFGVISPTLAFGAMAQMQQFVRDQRHQPWDDWPKQRQLWMERKCIKVEQTVRKDFSGIFSSSTPTTPVKTKDVEESKKATQ